MPSQVRSRLTFLAAVLVMAGSVWLAFQDERSSSTTTFKETRAAERVSDAMQDQRVALRLFDLTGRRSFQRDFGQARRESDVALIRLVLLTSDESTAIRRSLRRQAAIAARWHASEEADDLTNGADQPRSAEARRAFDRRAATFARFQAENAHFQRLLDHKRDRAEKRAAYTAGGVILLLGLIFGGLGYFLVERRGGAVRKQELDRARHQAAHGKFTDTLQIMRNEDEAHELVKRHLERTVAGADVTVLNRNNSDNRLEPATPVADSSELGSRLIDAEPESCLAVRLGRAHQDGSGLDPLLTCELCGARGKEIACLPSLVGGEVIGSVLVERDSPISASDYERVEQSVAQAAPVLANLRSLAMAESRAATDALTGLPNARACHDTLKRMVAQAGRTLAPLSALLLDLDHFKTINDRHGHGSGDEVLAAVGDVLTSRVRASDFCGRYGGEEFLILLPETDAAHAAEVAEELRAAVAKVDITQIERPITASFGVASFPEHALDSETLVRMADRALYAAKAAGRNRVTLAESSAEALDADRAGDSDLTASG